MTVLDFLVNNYANIILAIAFLVTIFLSGLFRDRKTYIIFGFLGLSIVYTILRYFYTVEKGSAELLIICVSMVLEMLLYSYYIIPLSRKYHLIYILPFLAYIPVLLILNDYLRVTAAAFTVYLIMHTVRGIRLIIKKEKYEGIVLISCTIVSFLSLILDYVSGDLSLLGFTLILCSSVFFVRAIVIQENRKKVAQEKSIQNQKTSIAISQIQPHFLYNSLATIGYLCKKDPQTASMAIDKFSDYLRANLNSLSRMENVPFMEELKHVETYLWLEKLRFQERLEIEYDIGVSNFLIPALSVQPLVENAVKHGICSKIEGGKVIIRTIEYSECVKVVIEDNGAGFDVNSSGKKDGKTHVGIENVKKRIASMAGGTLEVQSTVGRGTVSTITIPGKRI